MEFAGIIGLMMGKKKSHWIEFAGIIGLMVVGKKIPGLGFRNLAESNLRVSSTCVENSHTSLNLTLI